MSLWSNTKQPNTDLQHKLDSAKTADDTKKVTIDNKSKNGQDSEQKKNRPPNTAPTNRSSLQAALIKTGLQIPLLPPVRHYKPL